MRLEKGQTLVLALAIWGLVLLFLGGPFLGGQPPAPPQAPAMAASPAVGLALGQGLDINLASAAELELLPGIGPRLAGRIVKARRERGPFERAEDLLSVSGIGPATLTRIKPFLSRDGLTPPGTGF